MQKIKKFLDISDLTPELLREITMSQKDNKILSNKNIGFIFENYSTRTRLSFATGINQLGGNSVDLNFDQLNFSRSESFEDTFRAFNCYLDGLVYRCIDHQSLIDASKYFDKPIINALSDKSHPCQIISDLFTLYEIFKTFELNILWIGDMNNVCYSLVEAVNLLSEINLTICCPSQISHNKNWKFNKNIKIIENIEEIYLETVKCVMTDVYISMNDKDSNSKIELLRPYTVNSKLMSKTSHDSVFMHCLPAKIGYEVDENVFKSKKSIVWKQAYNRLIAQKKLLQLIDWN